MKNAGKGSRQIRPVTLGKGLALVLRGSGCQVVALLKVLICAILRYCTTGVIDCAALDDAHSMQQTRTATGKGNPTV